MLCFSRWQAGWGQGVCAGRIPHVLLVLPRAVAKALDPRSGMSWQACSVQGLAGV